MSAISKPMAHSTTSTNPFAEVPVEQVTAVNQLIVPAVANYGPRYLLSFSLMNNLPAITFEYATAAALSTARSAYRTLVSTNF